MWRVESIQRQMFAGRAMVSLKADWDSTTRETLPMNSDELDRQDVRVGDSVSLVFKGGVWHAMKEV